jgi:hypothetical protein
MSTCADIIGRAPSFRTNFLGRQFGLAALQTMILKHRILFVSGVLNIQAFPRKVRALRTCRIIGQASPHILWSVVGYPAHFRDLIEKFTVERTTHVRPLSPIYKSIHTNVW